MTEARIFGEHDERTKEQMARCMQYGSVRGGVLCADGHLGYAQPVGGVIAYDEHISVSGVGFDIACGNMAVKLDVPKKAIEARIEPILQDIAANVSFGLGRTNKEKVEHEVFDSPLWQKSDVVGRLKSMAREQLGTVGSGNHYVDLFEDEEGFVWIGVHFGSRGLGHKTATGFLKLAGGKEGIDVAPTLLHQDSDLGRQYLAGMTLAGQYAYAGREWVIERVRSIIGGELLDTVHNHHNYAWRERHGDRELWVVRKGATPAFPGQRGFVGGSMGDDAVILAGVESAASAASLYSTVHGAGRIMSRTSMGMRYIFSTFATSRVSSISCVCKSVCLLLRYCFLSSVPPFGASHIESSLLPITASFTSSRTLSTVKVSGVTRPATTVSPRPQLALKTASS